MTDAGVELTGAEFGAFFYNFEDERGESYMLYTLSGAPVEAFSKGHLGEPEELAFVAALLASHESSYDGAELVVDGGWTQV